MNIPLNYIFEAFPVLSDITLLKMGGQKIVYSAIHDQFGKIALKLIPLLHADDRIRREIHTGREKSFSNVPRLFIDGTISIHGADFVYIVEQFIEGEDLRRLKERAYFFSFNEVMSMLESMLTTLVQLEEEHIVHRDIKLDNIIRDIHGNFWLIDFGIARDLDAVSLTDSSACLGPHTLGYASPEQLLNQKKMIDSRSDLFSLGVVTYELLTGINPFLEQSTGVMDVLNKTQTFTPDPLKIQEDKTGRISVFIQTLLQKSPMWRPPTARSAHDWFLEIKSGE